METALPVSTPGTRRILENSLEGMKGRVATLDKKISEAIKEREVQAREQAAAVAVLAQKETRLNESEKQAYSSFLKEDFFTKKDFGKLDEFYSHSWERLTDGGKEEMSHRVWEGVRHHEYEFSDLPKSVQEKEAKLAYEKLTAVAPDSDVKNIRAADRAEFVDAYRTGKQNTALHVLNRDSFRANLSLQASAGATHQAATAGKSSSDQGVLSDKPPPEPPVPSTESSAMTNIKQNMTALRGVALVDATSNPSTAALPNSLPSSVNGRSPV